MGCNILDKIWLGERIDRSERAVTFWLSRPQFRTIRTRQRPFRTFETCSVTRNATRRRSFKMPKNANFLTIEIARCVSFMRQKTAQMLGMRQVRHFYAFHFASQNWHFIAMPRRHPTARLAHITRAERITTNWTKMSTGSECNVIQAISSYCRMGLPALLRPSSCPTSTPAARTENSPAAVLRCPNTRPRTCRSANRRLLVLR